MEYTKGEWVVHEWGDKFQVVEAEVKVTEKPGIIMAGQLIIAKEITEANAHLIAEAPRMYEALKELTKEYDPQESWSPGINKALKALAKAESK